MTNEDCDTVSFAGMTIFGLFTRPSNILAKRIIDKTPFFL
jgi:hypothetical protein